MFLTALYRFIRARILTHVIRALVYALRVIFEKEKNRDGIASSSPQRASPLPLP